MGCTSSKNDVVGPAQLVGENQADNSISGDTNPSYHGTKDEPSSILHSNSLTSSRPLCAGDADSNIGNSTLVTNGNNAYCEQSSGCHVTARSILPPMNGNLDDDDTPILSSSWSSDSLKPAQKPTDDKKGFITFDVVLDENAGSNVPDMSHVALPRRLKRLEPLDNPPTLTSEMLAEKLQRAEEKRRKQLASRQMRRQKQEKSAEANANRPNEAYSSTGSESCDYLKIENEDTSNLLVAAEGERADGKTANKYTKDDLGDITGPCSNVTPKQCAVAGGDLADANVNNNAVSSSYRHRRQKPLHSAGQTTTTNGGAKKQRALPKPGSSNKQRLDSVPEE